MNRTLSIALACIELRYSCAPAAVVQTEALAFSVTPTARAALSTSSTLTPEPIATLMPKATATQEACAKMELPTDLNKIPACDPKDDY